MVELARDSAASPDKSDGFHYAKSRSRAVWPPARGRVLGTA